MANKKVLVGDYLQSGGSQHLPFEPGDVLFTPDGKEIALREQIPQNVQDVSEIQAVLNELNNFYHVGNITISRNIQGNVSQIIVAYPDSINKTIDFVYTSSGDIESIHVIRGTFDKTITFGRNSTGDVETISVT